MYIATDDPDANVPVVETKSIVILLFLSAEVCISCIVEYCLPFKYG